MTRHGTKPLSLSPAQDALFQTFADRIPRIPRRWRFLTRQLGADAVEQEARIVVVRSAQRFAARRRTDIPFTAVAALDVRCRLLLRTGAYSRKANVWREMPTTADGWSPEPPDHRGDTAPVDHRLLRIWLSPDACEQRWCLGWVERLVLFLRAVEGWRFAEIGRQFGLTGSAAKLVEEEAVRKLAAFRVARRRAMEGGEA
jgi:hypothetical protein